MVSKDKNDKLQEGTTFQYACCPFYSGLFPNRHLVISTRHGHNECLEVGDRLYVYNSTHEKFEVKVIFYEDEEDFILFESTTRFPGTVPVLNEGVITGGCSYVMVVCLQNIIVIFFKLVIRAL